MCQFVLVLACYGRVRNDWLSHTGAGQESEGGPLRSAKLQ